jgi:hypothetical protein
MHKKYGPIIGLSLILSFIFLLILFGGLYYRTNSRQHHELLIEEARIWFRRNINLIDKQDKTPTLSIFLDQYSNGLKMLDAYKDNPIPPSLFIAGLRYRNLPKGRSKVLDIMWLETGNNVEGIYLIIEDKSYEYHNVFDDNIMHKYVNESLYRSYAFGLELSDEAISNTDREHCVIHLPSNIIDTLYSDKDNNIQIGLLLKDQTKSPTIRLWQLYLLALDKKL